MTAVTPNSTAAASYYAAGSEEVAVETPLLARKLEKRRMLTSDHERLVIVLVGLPARGKSFLSRKLRNFLLWSNQKCHVFNVGKYRREASDSGSKATANFFSSDNSAAAQQRQQAAALALQDLLSWLDGEELEEERRKIKNEKEQQDSSKSSSSIESNGSTNSMGNSDSANKRSGPNRIAIFDATNSTNERRNWILQQCQNHSMLHSNNKSPIGVVFVESLCTDKELLRENYLFKVRSSPDYLATNNSKFKTEEEALADLELRVQNYEAQYETIEDDSLSYIKIYNLSTKLLVNHIYGRMAKLIVPALMAWNVGTRPIFLCRAGETPSSFKKKQSSRIIMEQQHKHQEEEPEQTSSSSSSSLSSSSSAASSPSSLPKRLLATSSSTSPKLNSSYNIKKVKITDEQEMVTQCPTTTNTNICYHTRQPKREKLGLMGRKFRQRLEDYIAKECTEFMKRQQQPQTKQPYPLYTGTSMSGLSTSYPLPPSPQRHPHLQHHHGNEYQDSSSSSPQHKFPLKIVTSTMPRAVDTVSWNHSFPATTSPNLNPLDKGDFSGMDEDDIRSFDPQWFQQFTSESYFTRYPGGECYSDLVTRLEPVVIEVEQQTAPVLVVSHISTLQALVCYFRNPDKNPVESCMDINIPLHTVIKFTPSRGGGWKESRHSLLLGDEEDPSNKSSLLFDNSNERKLGHNNNLSLLSLDVAPVAPQEKEEDPNTIAVTTESLSTHEQHQ